MFFCFCFFFIFSNLLFVCLQVCQMPVMPHQWATHNETPQHNKVCSTTYTLINSLAPGRFEGNFRSVIFKLIIKKLVTEVSSVKLPSPECHRTLLTNDKSTLVQVMAWCCQATSHYLSQCWPSFLLPYGITRPQWVKTLRPRQNGHHFQDRIFKCISLNEYCLVLP